VISKVAAERIDRRCVTVHVLPRWLLLKGPGREESCALRASCFPLPSPTERLRHVLRFACTCARPLTAHFLAQDTCRRNVLFLFPNDVRFLFPNDALSDARPCVRNESGAVFAILFRARARTWLEQDAGHAETRTRGHEHVTDRMNL